MSDHDARGGDAVPAASPVASGPEAAPALAAPYRPDPRIRWGLPAALLGVAAVAVVFVLVLLAVRGLGLDADWAQLVVWVLCYGFVLLVAWSIARTRGTGSLRADYGLAFRWFDVLIGLGSAVVLIVVTSPITVFLQALLGGRPQSNDEAAGSSGVWLVLNGFVAVAVVAPFCEELLLRGLVLRGIRNSILRGSAGDPSAVRRRAAAIVAVVGSAVLFAALHLHEGIGSPVTMATLGATTLCLGLVNGVYAAALGRLGPGMWTHAWFNLIVATVTTLRAHG